MEFALKNFNKIIFDLDGVITTEDAYWNCAVLTVYELCESKNYYGTREIDPRRLMENIKNLRNEYFCGDEFIRLMKNFGVNSNWDLTYTLLAGRLGLKTNNFPHILEHFKSLNLKTPEIYDHCENLLNTYFPGSNCSHSGKLWQTIKSVFNEWYYGDTFYERTFGFKPMLSGKQGFITIELPMHGIEKTNYLLRTLSSAGISLAIGTGRPEFEVMYPLKRWGLDKYFDPDYIITFDDVETASKQCGTYLSKPEPYSFLKAMLGKQTGNNDILNGNYSKAQLKTCLAVGDAGADIFAAKKAGMPFAAVLTGVNGSAAKSFFEQNNADFILNTVLDLI